MILLDQEQIDLLDLEQCQEQLDLISQTYKLDLPLQEYTDFDYTQLDQLTNMMLYLEDRKIRIRQLEHLDSIRHTLADTLN